MVQRDLQAIVEPELAAKLTLYASRLFRTPAGRFVQRLIEAIPLPQAEIISARRQLKKLMPKKRRLYHKYLMDF